MAVGSGVNFSAFDDEKDKVDINTSSFDDKPTVKKKDVKVEPTVKESQTGSPKTQPGGGLKISQGKVTLGTQRSTYEDQPKTVTVQEKEKIQKAIEAAPKPITTAPAKELTQDEIRAKIKQGQYESAAQQVGGTGEAYLVSEYTGFEDAHNRDKAARDRLKSLEHEYSKKYDTWRAKNQFGEFGVTSPNRKKAEADMVWLSASEKAELARAKSEQRAAEADIKRFKSSMANILESDINNSLISNASSVMYADGRKMYLKDSESVSYSDDDRKIYNGAMNGFTKEGEYGIIVDIDKIAQEAERQAKRRNLPEKGYFYEEYKRNLTGAVEAQILKQKIDDEFSSLYRQTAGESLPQTMAKASKENQERFKKELENYADFKTIETQYSETAKATQSEVKFRLDQDIKSLEDQYTNQYNALMEEVKNDKQIEMAQLEFANAEIKRLTEMVKSGQMTLEQANEYLKSEDYKTKMSAAVQPIVDQNYAQRATAIFDEYMKNANGVRTRAQEGYSRRMAALKAQYQPAMERAIDNFEKQFKGTEIDKKLIKDLYEKAYKNVLTSESKRHMSIAMDNSWFANFSNEFIGSMGGVFKNVGQAIGDENMRLWGEDVEKYYFNYNPKELTSISDLTKSGATSTYFGSMLGRMIPGTVVGAAVTAATGGAGAPIGAAIVMGGLTSWWFESTDMAMSMYNDVLEQTGDYARADKARDEVFNEQTKIILLYASDMVPIFGKMPFKSPIARGTGQVLLETGTELTQEYVQGSSEEDILDAATNLNVPIDDIKAKALNWDGEKFKNTALNTIPLTIAMGGGPSAISGTWDMSKSAYFKNKARSYQAKVDMSAVTNANADQALYRVFMEKGGNTATAMNELLFANGTIDQATREKNSIAIENFKKLKGIHSKLGMTEKDGPLQMASMVMFGKYTQALDAYNAETDPSVKEILNKKMEDAKKAWLGLMEGKTPNMVVMILPSGEYFMYDPVQAEMMLDDEKIQKQVLDGTIKIQVTNTAEAKEYANVMGKIEALMNAVPEPSWREKTAEEKAAESAANPDKERKDAVRMDIEVSEAVPTVEEALRNGGTFEINGEVGSLFREGDMVLVETPTRKIELGNISEISEKTVAEVGLKAQKALDLQINDDNSVTVEGIRYVNNYSDPMAAVSVDKDGNYSVSLETEKGQKRTFRKGRAEAIVYQMKLKQLENATEQQITEVSRLADEALASQGKVEPTTIEPAVEGAGVAGQEQAAIQPEPVTVKPKTDAIQVETAGQVPVQPEAKPSQEVAEGKPQAEPEKVAEKSIEEEVAAIESDRKKELKENEYRTTVKSEIFKGTDTVGSELYVQVLTNKDGSRKINIVDKNGVLIENITTLKPDESSVRIEDVAPLEKTEPITKVSEKNFKDSENKTVQKINAKYDAKIKSIKEEGVKEEVTPAKKERKWTPSETLNKLRERQKKFSADSVDKAVDSINSALKSSGIKATIIESQQEWEKETKGQGRGASGIFITKDGSGRILINRQKLQEGWQTTVVWHEGTHPVINIIRNTNPKLYQRMVRGLEKARRTAPKEVRDEIQFAFDFVSKEYKGEPELTIEDESLVETIGRVGDGKIDINQLPKSFRQTIIDFVNEMAQFFGLDPILADTDLATFQRTAKAISDALKSGKDISSIVGKENVTRFEFEGGKQRQAEGLMAEKGLPKMKSLDQVVSYLQDWVEKNKLFDDSIENISDSEVIEKLADHVYAEIKAWESLKGSKYIGFYDEDIPMVLNPELQKFAIERYGRPLTDQEVALYHIFSAFASPSADPVFDSSKGLEVFDKYMMTGKISAFTNEQATEWETNSKGERYDTGRLKFDEDGNPVYKRVAKAYAVDSLEKLNMVVEAMGGDISKAIDWLLSSHSYEESSKMVGKPTKGPKSLDQNEYFTVENGGMGVFSITGVKLGSYILNRIGDFSTTTKDMWYARTLARLTGEPLMEKGKAIKTPWALTKAGIRKRRLADEAFKIVADKLGTSPADVQQKIWDFEKRLYEMLGVTEKSGYPSQGLKAKAKEILSGQKEQRSSAGLRFSEKVNAIKAIPFNQDGGATLNLDGTDYTGGGLVVPIDTVNLTQETFDEQAILDFIRMNFDKIGNDKVRPGIYKFKDSNKVSIDLNIVIPREHKDLALEFGRFAGQESLWDLDKIDYEKTGSDGANPRKFTPEEFKEIANALTEGRIPNISGMPGYTEKAQESRGGVRTSAKDKVKGTYMEPFMTSDGKDYLFFHTSYGDPKSIMKGIDSSKYYNTHTSKQEKSTQYGLASYYTQPRDGERMVGGDKYVVRVPKDKVYPMDIDPNGYRETAEKKYPSNYPFRDSWISKYIADKAKKDGFVMMVGEWGLDRSGKKKNTGVPNLRADAVVVLKPTREDYSDFKSNVEKGMGLVEHPAAAYDKLMDSLTKLGKSLYDYFSSVTTKDVDAKSNMAYDLSMTGQIEDPKTGEFRPIKMSEFDFMTKELPSRFSERVSKIKGEMASVPQVQKSTAGLRETKRGKIDWYKSPAGKGDPAISSRNPFVQQAAQDLKAGRITNAEYRATVSKNSPITTITTFYDPTTLDEMKSSLSQDKVDKIEVPLEDGTKVGARLDIPAYINHNKWINTIHEGHSSSGPALSYTNVSRLTNVTFEVSPIGAMNIAAGKNKNTIARMYGYWKNIAGSNPEQRGENAKRMVEAIVDNPNWVQVGMNPFRHSYFYDRSSDMGRPLVAADEVIQIGGLVYAKNPVYGNWTDAAYTVKGLLDAAGEAVQFSTAGERVSAQNSSASERFDSQEDMFETHQLYVDLAMEALESGVETYEEFIEGIDETKTALSENAWRDARRIAQGKDPMIKGPEDMVSGPKKALLTRAYQGGSQETLKDAIAELGLNYEVVTNEGAMAAASRFVDQVGIDDAVMAVRNGLMDGSQAAFVYSIIIDRLGSMQANAMTESERLELMSRQVALIGEFDARAREKGRFIQALSYVYAKSDFPYALDYVRDKLRQANNGNEVSAEVRVAVDNMISQITEISNKIREQERKIAQLEEQAAIDNIVSAALAEDKGKNKKSTTQKIADKIREGKLNRPGMFMSASPASIAWDAALETAATIIENGGKLADAIAAGVRSIRSSEWWKTSDEKTRAEGEKVLAQHLADSQYGAKKDKAEKPSLDQDGNIQIPFSLLKQLVNDGVNTIEEMTSIITDMLSTQYEGITERMVRDAITKYGKQKLPTKDETLRTIAEMKRDGQLLSALEDVESGKLPKKSGFQRDKPTDKQREMMRKIKDRMKELPQDQADIERSWASSQERIRTMLTNRIADLNAQIAAGKREARTNKSVELDDRNKQLKAEVERLNEELDNLVGKPQISHETKVKNAVRAIERTIADIEDMILKGDIGYRASGQKIEDPRIEMARERLKGLRDLLAQAREEQGVAEAYRISKYKERLKKDIAQMEQDLADGNFAKKENRDLSMADEEIKKLRAEKMKLKEKIDIEIEKVRRQNRTNREKAWDTAVDIFNIPRTMLASADLSAPLRQGLILSLRNPRIAAAAIRDMLRFAFSKVSEEQYIDALKSSPEYMVMKEAGLFLSLPSAELSAREEDFMSSIPEKIPFYGKIISGTQRAYTGYLNKLRADVFMSFHQQLLKEGYSGVELMENLKSFAGFINAASGRGRLPKALEPAGAALSGLFFAPRYVASRFEVLGRLATLGAGMPKAARKEMLKTMATYIGLGMMTMYMMAAAGAEVEDDPRSSDFGKIRLGDLRFDIWAGSQQIVVLFSRILTGATKKTGTGEIVPFYSGGWNEANIWTTIEDFLGNKLSPNAAILADFMKGEFKYDKKLFGMELAKQGDPFTWTAALAGSLAPIWINDIGEIYREQGLFDATIAGTASFFGIGVQFYGPSIKDKIQNDIYQYFNENNADFESQEFNERFTEYAKDTLLPKYEADEDYSKDVRNEAYNTAKVLYLTNESPSWYRDAYYASTGDRRLAIILANTQGFSKTQLEKVIIDMGKRGVISEDFYYEKIEPLLAK